MNSTADTVLASLRQMIVSGDIADGARLVERDLAEQFSISRIPLREAIQRLAQEGLVEIHRNRGAVVRELTASDIREIYALRALMEGSAIYASVKHLDEETMARAELAHRLLGLEPSPTRQGALNREFHSLLYARCNNGRQLRLIEELRNQVERYERLQNSLLAQTSAFQHEHQDILQACRERDARGARTLVLKHLQSAQAVALQAIKDRQSG